MGESKFTKNTISKDKTKKCTKCNNTFPKKELKKYSKQGDFCSACYIEVQQEGEEYKNLITQICTLYNIKSPPMLIVKQIKDFKDKYNFTNVGIQYTLQYYYYVLENIVNTDMGIGIVPYYYDKAKTYYNKKFTLEDIASNFTINEKVVNNIPAKTSTQNKYKLLDYDIDWSDQEIEE